MSSRKELPKRTIARLTEYLEKSKALDAREPERVESVLSDEENERIFNYLLRGIGEKPEHADRFTVHEIADPKTGKPTKAYYDTVWESWNAESVALTDEYHDDIVQAIRYFLRYIETGKSEEQDAQQVTIIIKTVIDAALKSPNIELAEEVRQALPQLTSILPQKHVMPNNKLANKLTSFENSHLIDAAAIDLVVSGRGKAEVTTRCILSYEGDSVTLSSRQPFTEYDRNVADAVTSLYEYGDPSHIITPATVYRAMVHQTNRETPSAQTLGAVTRSLDKMRFVRVQIDCTDELTRRKANLDGAQITGGKIDTYLLALEKVEVMASGKKVTAYKIIKAPVLYDYARLTNQVLTVPAKLLDVPNQSNSEQRIAIKGYLLRRIKVMQGRTPQSNRILFEKVFEAAGKPDATKTEKGRIRDYTTAVLDYWKAEKFIKGYSIAKDGKSVIGVDIQP